MSWLVISAVLLGLAIRGAPACHGSAVGKYVPLDLSPPYVFPQTSVHEVVIPGPVPNDPTGGGPVQTAVGSYTCPATAIYCTATIIAPGAYGSVSGGGACGGGGSFVTDIYLAASQTYGYELTSPASLFQTPGFTTLFSASRAYFLKAHAGASWVSGNSGFGGTIETIYPYGITPGRLYNGAIGPRSTTCTGGTSWSRGLRSTDQNIAYVKGSPYPWGGGGAINQYGGRGAILVSEFY
jgi:hypothetical protein